MRQLQHKVAVITGAAGGIGRALTQQLINAGCHLALADLNTQGLDALAAEFQDSPQRVTCHKVDVRSYQAMTAFAASVKELHGGAHLLINNAGLTVFGNFADMSIEQIDTVLNVNLRGVVYGCKAFLPLLSSAAAGDSGGAHIVNISSLAGMVGFPMQTTYCASKFGVRGLSQALRIELGSRGIGVTGVMPGTIATPFLETAASHDQDMTQQLAKYMLRHGTPPQRLAKRILRAVQSNRHEIVVGPDSVLTWWGQNFVPWLMRWVLALLHKRFEGPQS